MKIPSTIRPKSDHWWSGLKVAGFMLGWLCILYLTTYAYPIKTIQMSILHFFILVSALMCVGSGFMVLPRRKRAVDLDLEKQSIRWGRWMDRTCPWFKS